MNKIIKKVCRAGVERRRGFTLIELLMVIVIISVLVAIALPKYIDTVDIALGKRAYDSMQTIYAAQMRFSRENISNNYAFADSFNSLDVNFPSATLDSNTVMNFGGKFKIQLLNTQAVTTGLENYQLVFNFVDETKQCIVATNANSNKANRICAALGGTGGTSGIYNLR
ncbi:MAG: prepilin-type N-terminal cleavage/methylation domain-containing protein [Elusimicrobium sp.]|jgi:prepilin-type N-terminal cleavage/methylation domain-containing protein|nr:prepilin-type N-terminal cleavage/methylation domain-containing protein [Elusimicrobium sp.]